MRWLATSPLPWTCGTMGSGPGRRRDRRYDSITRRRSSGVGEEEHAVPWGEGRARPEAVRQQYKEALARCGGAPSSCSAGRI